jgi:hypothetical protein
MSTFKCTAVSPPEKAKFIRYTIKLLYHLVYTSVSVHISYCTVFIPERFASEIYTKLYAITISAFSCSLAHKFSIRQLKLTPK